MSKIEWERIKQIRPTQMLVWDSGKNGTFNIGRNKAKREANKWGFATKHIGKAERYKS